jgi:hypothetical protein
MEKEEKFNSITISLSKKVSKKLEEGDYNKSKLINKLLTEHFEKLQKEKK